MDFQRPIDRRIDGKAILVVKWILIGALVTFIVYFFWPGKTITVCGMISTRDGKVRASCATYTCDRGIPMEGIAAATCLGGKVVHVTPTQQ